ILRSGFRVTPVIGWWRDPSEVRPVDPGEVAAVERIPLAALADPRRRFMLRGPTGTLGPAFSIGPMLIWGFTAILTARLLALAGLERPRDAPLPRALPGACPHPPQSLLSGTDHADSPAPYCRRR